MNPSYRPLNDNQHFRQDQHSRRLPLPYQQFPMNAAGAIASHAPRALSIRKATHKISKPMLTMALHPPYLLNLQKRDTSWLAAATSPAQGLRWNWTRMMKYGMWCIGKGFAVRNRSRRQWKRRRDCCGGWMRRMWGSGREKCKRFWRARMIILSDGSDEYICKMIPFVHWGNYHAIIDCERKLWTLLDLTSGRNGCDPTFSSKITRNGLKGRCCQSVPMYDYETNFQVVGK